MSSSVNFAEARGLRYAGAHERYKSLRSSFYADISGVIIVVEAASRRCTSLTSHCR